MRHEPRHGVDQTFEKRKNLFLRHFKNSEMSGETEITLRKATGNDIEVLKYWDTQLHVIESDPNDDWNWEQELIRDPEWREQLIAELNGRPIGFIQIIDPVLEESHYWGDMPNNMKAIDIWIGEASNLGKGYGTRMMHLALARCFENPKTEAIWIDPLNSNKSAQRFYQRLGFEWVENRFFGQDYTSVFKLTREKWSQR